MIQIIIGMLIAKAAANGLRSLYKAGADVATRTTDAVANAVVGLFATINEWISGNALTGDEAVLNKMLKEGLKDAAVYDVGIFKKDGSLRTSNSWQSVTPDPELEKLLAGRPRVTLNIS